MGFLNFLLTGVILMDCVTFLKHLTLDCELGCGFLLFGIVKQVSENLGLFLLFTIGLKLLNSDWFSRVWAQILCDLRGKSGKLKNGVCSKIVLDWNYGVSKLPKELDEPLFCNIEKIKEISNLFTFSDEKLSTGADEEHVTDDNDGDSEKDCKVEDTEFDVSALRNLIKIERHRANAAVAELEKERAASAIAAEEAMAMILRLQNEKSLIGLESSQYRRLAEEKQIHDQKVIESLQWLVWRHESERGLLEDQLKSCKQMLNKFQKIDESEEVEEDVSSFNGNILDALDNMLYSSRDANLSPERKREGTLSTSLGRKFGLFWEQGKCLEDNLNKEIDFY